MNAAIFLIPGFSLDPWHQRSICSLCLLFKIYHNLKHALYSDLHGLLCPAQVTRGALGSNTLDFSFVRSNTTHFTRNFIPAVTKL